MTRHHLRNEMDSISEEYCVDRADIGSAQSEPVVSVAAWSSATAATRRSRASFRVPLPSGEIEGVQDGAGGRVRCRVERLQR